MNITKGLVLTFLTAFALSAPYAYAKKPIVIIEKTVTQPVTNPIVIVDKRK